VPDAVCRRHCSTSTGEHCLQTDHTLAMAPVTCGADILVPVTLAYPPDRTVELTETPGAAMSTLPLYCENPALFLLRK
jgi:hypothetical protein